MWLRALENPEDGEEEKMCDFQLGAGDVKVKEVSLDLNS